MPIIHRTYRFIFYANFVQDLQRSAFLSRFAPTALCSAVFCVTSLIHIFADTIRPYPDSLQLFRAPRLNDLQSQKFDVCQKPYKEIVSSVLCFLPPPEIFFGHCTFFSSLIFQVLRSLSVAQNVTYKVVT